MRIAPEQEKNSDFLFDFFAAKKWEEGENSEYDDESGAHVTKQAVKRIISNELSERQKIYLVEYVVNKYPMWYIAERHQVRTSTVSRTIKRARRRIYERIKYPNLRFMGAEFIERNGYNRFNEVEE